MAENVGSDESEFESVTSSQKSFLKNCPFAGHESLPTDSVNTEVLANQISPAVVRTPILSFSTSTSLDSINDEFFRTPPENASLSSAADSETRVRVSEMKSPTTPVSASPSENLGVLETKRPSDSVTSTGVLKPDLVPLSSPPSVAADDVRVPGKLPDFDSSSPTEIGRTMVMENYPISDSMANTGASKSPDTVIKNSETENSGGDLPFKEIIEALLRNSGENLKNVSYVDILKQCGLKFP